MNLKTILLTFLVCTIHFLSAQPFIGQREVLNFSKQTYNAGTQNWNIRQDSYGRLYFANNEGVLRYDGNYWKITPLPNKTIVWSIEFGKDNRLYVGGQDEMGFFSPDKNGNLAYSSLKNLLEEQDQKFADIWHIIQSAEGVFFQSNAKLFRYHNNKIAVYQPWTSWLFLGVDGNRVIAHDEGKGLLAYQSGTWETLIEKKSLPNSFYITSIMPLGKYSLLTTAKNGLFILSGNKLTSFTVKGDGFDNSQNFTGATRLDEDNYLIGTYNNGIYHINKEGIVIEHLGKPEGLQNNNIRSLFTDQYHNIWIGTSNGIDFIPYNSAIKHINPALFNDGSGYAVTTFQDNLYFALSNGIYSVPLSNNNDLSHIPNKVKLNTEGLTWQLGVLNNRLLAGRVDGLYVYKNEQFTAIDRTTGYWTFQSFQQADSDYLVAGNYLGVSLFNTSGDNFIPSGVIANLNTSSRFLAVDNTAHIIWVSHPYRGVYKINRPSNTVKLYTEANGLPSTLDNHVFKVKNKILVATVKGIYEYNAAKDSFIPSPDYSDIFKGISIRYLKEDTEGNIWFIHEKSVGVVDYSGKTPAIIYLPELTGRILSGFEHIYPLNKNNIFIGGELGFYHINYELYKKNIHPLKIFISTVKAKSDSERIVFGGYHAAVNNDSWVQPKERIPTVQYRFNSFHFEYAAPFYEQQSNIEYSYYLKGFDKDWSEWTKKTEKDYTNLPSGSYTFQVKARNNLNTESTVCTYTFFISPPWYNTIWAWIIYVLLVFFMLYCTYRWQVNKLHKKQEQKLLEERKKYEEEQRNIAYQHQLALEKSERELIQLQNEKLEAEIEYKNSELASTAMNLVQKKEFLLKIKEELNKLNHQSKTGKDTIDAAELKKILKTLSEDEKLNDEWEQFSVHFNKVHSDFLITLKEKYPDLKPHELKLCAYLRMNLSSKEIANLMSISVRGVEISRYRLRKKLGIPTEVNLFQFLFDIESEKRKNDNPNEVAGSQ
ncbi:MAG: transcriptional regulator [Bacteroidota bacterium]|nr:transcriptional regulator [Bacteroidota bacterium]